MNAVVIVPIGGCGEVGMNLTALRIDGEWIFIDCGLLFPSERDIGVDAFVPELSWFREQGIRPLAWLITHGHEDHIGALPLLIEEFPAPIFAPEIAAEFIEEKFRDSKRGKPQVNVVHSTKSFALGGARVTPLGVSHSFPDACGYLVETLQGNLLFTGDFRLQVAAEAEQLFLNVRERLGSEEVHVLFADSTNALVPGKDRDEADVALGLTEAMQETTGKVAVVTFASSLWRFRSVLLAARECGRKVLFLGRSMERNVVFAKRFGLLRGVEDVIATEDEFTSLSDAKRCLLASGCQGEVFSGAFRLAHGHDKNHLFGDGDLLILSSRTIPGNERSVAALLNHFARRGVRIVTARERLVHVSGHGFRDDISALVKGINPSFYVPIHGEYRQLLANGDVARESGVPEENVFVIENGESLSLLEGVCSRKPDKVPVGRRCVCAGRITPQEVVRQRFSLAEGGSVCVVFVLLRDGNLACDPRVVVRGVDALEVEIQKGLPRIFGRVVAQTSLKKLSVLEEALRLPVRRLVEGLTGGARPVVSIIVERLQ